MAQPVCWEDCHLSIVCFVLFGVFFAMPLHPAALDGELIVFSVSCMLGIEQGET